MDKEINARKTAIYKWKYNSLKGEDNITPENGENQICAKN